MPPTAGNQAQQSALNEDNDLFKILLDNISALRERPELVPDEVSAEDVVDTDSGILTSDIGSLSDSFMQKPDSSGRG